MFDRYATMLSSGASAVQQVKPKLLSIARPLFRLATQLPEYVTKTQQLVSQRPVCCGLSRKRPSQINCYLPIFLRPVVSHRLVPEDVRVWNKWISSLGCFDLPS